MKTNRRGLLKMLALAPWFGGMPRAAGTPAETSAFDPFFVYYSHRYDPAISRYRLAVLDSDVDDAMLRGAPATRKLGYLTVGEADSFRSYFPEVEREGLLRETNPLWPESRFVDLRDTRWRDRLVDGLAPAIMARGFDGLILDTLDNAGEMERLDPEGSVGMVEAAAGIVRALRRRLPEATIMINRGYEVLPHIAGEFDMLLGECVIGGFDFERNYVEVEPEEYRWQLRQMRRAWRRDRRLKLFSLDYWDPADDAGIARVHALQRANGFIPYVSTPDLMSIQEARWSPSQ